MPSLVGNGRCCGGRSLAIVNSGLEIDSSAWHDGGNSVFVDHLRHGVAQQNDVLVERFDLALKLDAVDEVDRHRHVFTAKLVEEWDLQELALLVTICSVFKRCL